MALYVISFYGGSIERYTVEYTLQSIHPINIKPEANLPCI